MEIQIDGLYTKLLRMIFNVSWMDHMTNEELYGDIPRLSLTIRQRKMRFAGHCYRANDQPVSKLVFWTSNEGKKPRGAGYKTYPKVLGEDTGLTSDSEVQVLMKDKKIWRERVKSAMISSKGD